MFNQIKNKTHMRRIRRSHATKKTHDDLPNREVKKKENNEREKELLLI